MRFAVISDVHGNLPALNAVIEDAKKKSAECYIFVGDYCLNNPFPDACVTRIRELENKYVIRGNEERYLEHLVGKDQSTWTDGQMQISYWVYKSLSMENLKYLLSLPTQMHVAHKGISLYLSHSSADFIDDCEHKEWRTSKVAERYGDKFISPETLREDIHNYFDKDKKSQKIFHSLAEGIYIFGHTHIQWSYKSNDGKRILINPGSCGLPLDCVESGMPYTLLDISDNGAIGVEERRVPFDKENYIDLLLKSQQFANARVWTKIVAKELKTNREQITFFLKYVEEYATEIEDPQRPFSVSTWEQAFARCGERYRI